MATMNISLPDQMKKWVEAQITTGRYANVSDFVRDLMREKYDYDMKLENLRQLLIEGEESGISIKNKKEILQESRKRARQQGLIDD